MVVTTVTAGVGRRFGGVVNFPGAGPIKRDPLVNVTGGRSLAGGCTAAVRGLRRRGGPSGGGDWGEHSDAGLGVGVLVLLKLLGGKGSGET